MQEGSSYYTYLWLREDGTPYYVGKGKGKRAFTSQAHGVKCPTDPAFILVQPHPSEADAFAAEMFLISYYGRADQKQGCLRNRTDGGEGSSGRVLSEESIRKMREATLAIKPSARRDIDTHELVRLYQDGKTLTDLSHQFGCSKAMIRVRFNKLGIKRRPVGKSEMTQARKDASRSGRLGKKASPETLKKMSDARKGVIPTNKRFDILDEDLIRLYSAGLSLHQIGDKFNCNWSSIRLRLLKKGVAMRPANRRKGAIICGDSRSTSFGPAKTDSFRAS
jgi:hypothetical protein